MICVLLGGFFFSLQIEVCEKAKVLLQRLDINHNLMNTKKIHVCMHRFPCNSILFYYYYYLIYITHMNNICGNLFLFIYLFFRKIGQVSPWSRQRPTAEAPLWLPVPQIGFEAKSALVGQHIEKREGERVDTDVTEAGEYREFHHAWLGRLQIMTCSPWWGV